MKTLTEYHRTVDCAAEAEADAIERLSEMLGEPVQRDPIKVLGDQIAAAAAMGLSWKPTGPFPVNRAVRAWLRIVDAIAAGH